MKAAGITAVQPGIESLSSPILRIMRKGIKAIHNIQFLKHCRQLSIIPHWNIIWGFPGEAAEEYREMAVILPHLRHLHPPSGCGPIRLDRFSPNFVQAEELGFQNVRPNQNYERIYNLDVTELSRLSLGCPSMSAAEGEVDIIVRGRHQ
ncbi:hypothetical protein ACNJYD_06620 [Bradyrhizobium sp. DASA03005]|uniref:hypothetical protein n=1 Tax=Bradyrhizobium sp. SPXBL-02 TaxID=3395912 RepID=UPI003F6FF83D